MAGKLGSRVRSLSEAEFRAAYGTEEQCRAAVEELRWPMGFVCPVCGGREGTRLRHPAKDPVPLVPAPSVVHGRHDLRRHQAAAHELVPGDPADHDGSGRDHLGRAGAKARDQADQRLGAEAEGPPGDRARRLDVPGRPPPAQAQVAAGQDYPKTGNCKAPSAYDPSYLGRKMNSIVSRCRVTGLRRG
jgi:hypothetical protein